jgi:hypothetical protein
MSEIVWDIQNAGFGELTSESDSRAAWAGIGRLIGFRSPGPSGNANLAKARAPRTFFCDGLAGNRDCFLAGVREGVWLGPATVNVPGILGDCCLMFDGISDI